MKFSSCLTILAALVCAMPAARAEDFYFSFSGDPNGGSPGTVTGELVGLSPTGTSSPTDVLLLSNTDGVRNGDLFAMGWFNDYGSPNSFTVTNGAITAEDFTLFSANTDDFLSLGLHFNGVEFNLLYDALTDLQTGNAAGVDGVTFIPVDVPEPKRFGIVLLTSAMAAGLARHFAQKKTWLALVPRVSDSAGRGKEGKALLF